MPRISLPLDAPYDPGASFAHLRHGKADPSIEIGNGAVTRATRTPEGPATMRIEVGDGQVNVEAWGPGADWVLEHADHLTGLADDASQFDPSLNERVLQLHRGHPGLRLPRTEAVFEALVPAVLGQRVTVFEAQRAFRQLVSLYGEPAPGPCGLRLLPDPNRLAGIPYYDLHQCGVEQGRADTLRRIAAGAAHLEETVSLSLADARRRLTSIAGVGPWTAALTAVAAFGDPDAVLLGDLHLPNQVAWLLAGEDRADDARMLDLLEPWHGQRARVIQLVLVSGTRPPRRSPRARVADVRAN